MDKHEEDLLPTDRGDALSRESVEHLHEKGLEVGDDEAILEEVKIEEVGIDGMCGVY
jgi:mycofactocin precursor